MKALLSLIAAVLLAVVLPGCGGDTSSASCAPPSGQSIAREWNEAALAAIRRADPAPTLHARNLYHLSAAMWDAWAAFDDQGTGVFFNERREAENLAEARHAAISFAAHTLLVRRYGSALGGRESLDEFDALMARHCYGTEVDRSEDTPAALGSRIAGTIIAETIDDGSLEPLGYLGPYELANDPLRVAVSGTVMRDPDRWQPLQFETAPYENGYSNDAVQLFLTPQWGFVDGFALDPNADGLPIDPGPPPTLTDAATRELFRAEAVEVIRASAALDTQSGDMIDISPAVRGASPLGSDAGSGHAQNPSTGAGYAPNVVSTADWARSIAEYWADGPDSETPPGHWNTIANAVSDHEQAEHRLAGAGPKLDRLEWDVRTYLVLNGALHDAAVAAWGSKAFYDYTRPISMIRYMGGAGQSSEPDGPSYSEHGLPLIEGLIEVVTDTSAAAGQHHAHLADSVGHVAIRAWSGHPTTPDQVGGVDWLRAVDWQPYQQASFVTPSFPGYVSGHSAFSRAAAEVLSRLTGDAYFPGGMGEFVFRADTLQFEAGPSEDITLQWATYRDAADEAGLSRIYGGIHVSVDDYPGRIMGATVGEQAWQQALELWGL